MQIPQGMTETEVIGIINTVCDIVSPTFKFGCYTVEDIRQESWIFAMEALPRFNPKRGQYADLKNKLTVFLLRHVKNHLINLKRNKFSRVSPPCECCPHNQNFKSCAKYVNRDECKKWVGWNKRNNSKKSLMMSGDRDVSTIIKDDEKVDVSLSREIRAIIDKELPLEYRADYCKFTNGGKLSKKSKAAIMSLITEILIRNGFIEETSG